MIEDADFSSVPIKELTFGIASIYAEDKEEPFHTAYPGTTNQSCLRL